MGAAVHPLLIDAARPTRHLAGDLGEAVVLERGQDVQAENVAVVLSGALCEVAQLEVAEPEFRQVDKRARASQRHSTTRFRAVCESLLESMAGGRGGPARHADLSDSAVMIADAGLRDYAPAATTDVSTRRRRAESWDDPSQHPNAGWRSASASSIRASQASISLTRNRS